MLRKIEDTKEYYLPIYRAGQAPAMVTITNSRPVVVGYHWYLGASHLCVGEDECLGCNQINQPKVMAWVLVKNSEHTLGRAMLELRASSLIEWNYPNWQGITIQIRGGGKREKDKIIVLGREEGAYKRHDEQLSLLNGFAGLHKLPPLASMDDEQEWIDRCKRIAATRWRLMLKK